MNDGAALFAEGSPWLLCEGRTGGGAHGGSEDTRAGEVTGDQLKEDGRVASGRSDGDPQE